MAGHNQDVIDLMNRVAELEGEVDEWREKAHNNASEVMCYVQADDDLKAEVSSLKQWRLEWQDEAQMLRTMLATADQDRDRLKQRLGRAREIMERASSWVPDHTRTYKDLWAYMGRPISPGNVQDVS